MAQAEPTDTSGPSLKWVFGGMAVVTVAMGVGGYYRYAQSEDYIAYGIEQMDRRGPQLDVEGCVDAVIGWHHDCDVNDANAAVCMQGVGMAMFHCLAGADRSEECKPYDEPQSSGKWVQRVCEERGMRCINKRECACAEAYRAVDSFCRTGGEAIQL